MEKLYCIPRHQYAFRPNIAAEITGMVRVRGKDCYALTYDDGVKDYIPVDGGYDIELKTMREICTKNE